MKKRACLFAITALIASFALAPHVRAETPAPIVIELFTSQGCSSCPPADAYLGELAGDDTLLPLSLHVDYWDYIGWADPFADPAHTTRQQKYKHRFATRYVYTPQMVVDGRWQDVGSKKQAIANLIAEARRQPHLDVTLARDGDRVRIRIAADKTHATTTATIWLVGFDAHHDTPIRRGENGGRTLSYYNVVRAMVPVGHWRGEAFDQAVPLPPHPEGAAGGAAMGMAVIVQQDETGPILGAAQIRPDGR